MPAGVSFADVLEEKLGAIQPERSIRGVQPTYRPLPPNPFLFVEPQRHFRATPYSGMGRSVGALRDVRPTVSGTIVPSRANQAARSLTALEERALAALVALGADLRVDFTANELRSAFRTLARRYHPDAHPASNPAEAARLSRVFTDLHAQYRRLRAVPEPASTMRS